MNRLRRSRREEQLSEEIGSHLELAIQDRMARGETREQAERNARGELGSVARIRELTRETWGWTALETILRDIRYGLRMLGKSPGLTTIVTATLALGIGANTAVFSLLNGWLLRPLPVRNPEQLIVLASRQKERRSANISYLDVLEFQRQMTVFTDVFGWRFGIGGMSAGGEARQFAYSTVTGNYFSALGVTPALGRLFLPGESEKPGDPLLVVLGFGYWQTRFGGDPGIVGRQVHVNGRAATVVGVTPAEFHGTFFSATMDGYLPLSAMSLEQTPNGDANGFWTDRHNKQLTVLARLKPGVGLRQAQSAVDVLAGRLAERYPAADAGVGVRVIPEKFARPAALVASFVPAIAAVFLALPGLLLVLACLNVANLLLARAAARRREMAVRAALGGGRARMIRQLLTESLVLALAGGLAGVALGEMAMRAGGWMLHSATTNSSGYSLSVDTGFDWRVFAYAMAAAVFTGVFVGSWPAWRASRPNVNLLLHAGRNDTAGMGRHGFRKALIVLQVAGSLLLLIVSGLFVRSLTRAQQMDLGFKPDHVLVVMMDPQSIGYNESRAKMFYKELKNRILAIPGVTSASLSFTVPLTYISKGGSIYVEGHPLPPNRQPPSISFNSVDPGYFETLRIPLIEGRSLRDSDDEAAPAVAIVNQAMARKFWPDGNPIGKRFSLKSAQGPYVEVVGLARNGQYMFLSPEAQPYFYLPLAQSYSSSRSLEVRSPAPLEALLPEVKRQIHDLSPDLPILNEGPLENVVQGLAGLLPFRLAATLAAILGTLGLALAVVGVYGVVSFSVTQRTQEIGIRMALGADRGEILKLVWRQGLTLAAIGVFAGLLAAWGLTRAMTKLLIGVSPADPLTYGLVAALLAMVTLVACWIPARRALRVDPISALRYE